MLRQDRASMRYWAAKSLDIAGSNCRWTRMHLYVYDGTLECVFGFSQPQFSRLVELSC